MKKLTEPVLVIDAPARSADLRYACGFLAPDPVVFLGTQTRRYLVVSALEYGRAQRTAANLKQRPPLTVIAAGELRLRGKQRYSLSHWAAALLNRVGHTRVTVPGTFPHGVAVRLAALGIRVIAARSTLFPERAVKRADELSAIAQSQRAAVAAMRAAVTRLRLATIAPDGTLREKRKRLTSEAVQETIHMTLLHLRAACPDVIVAGGQQGADPHERGHGLLYAGEPIVIDIFPQHMEHGYWGDLTRTVVRGRATETVRRQHAAVREAQRAALRTIKPGARLGTPHRAVMDVFRRRGFVRSGIHDGQPEGFIHSTGHGLGLDIHEGPWLALVDGRLRRGHVVTVEPGLYYRAHGGVRIEDTVVVTPAGWRLLARCPRMFEV